MGVGTLYRQTRTLPGRSQEDFEIVVFQPPGQLALDGTFGPFKARASYLLEPTASGTTLTNKWDLRPTSASLRLLGPLAVPKVRSAVALEPPHSETDPGKCPGIALIATANWGQAQ